jgi:hypothetical protein
MEADGQFELGETIVIRLRICERTYVPVIQAEFEIITTWNALKAVIEKVVNAFAREHQLPIASMSWLVTMQGAGRDQGRSVGAGAPFEIRSTEP